MKKTLLTLLFLAVGLVGASSLRAQTTTLWESNDREAQATTNWRRAYSMTADDVKTAGVSAGDYFVVTVDSVNPEGGWPQVAYFDGAVGWPPIANSGVSKTAAMPAQYEFPILYSTWETISKNGVSFSGGDVWISKVELKKGVEIGKYTVWFGNKACNWGNGVGLDKAIFADVKAGDKLMFWADGSHQVLLGGWSGLNIASYDGSVANKTTSNGVTTITMIDDYDGEKVYGKDNDGNDLKFDVFALMKANGVTLHGPCTLTRIDYVPYEEEEEEEEAEAWKCPDTEKLITTLPWVGAAPVNNIGATLNDDPVYGSQSDGDRYCDVADYMFVKIYGTPGATLRLFVNRNGSESVVVGKTEQDLTINSDGWVVMDVAAVKDATKQEDCRLSCVKVGWGQTNVTIKAITVPDLTKPAYTINTTAGKFGTIVFDYPTAISGGKLYDVAEWNAEQSLTLAEHKGLMVAGTPYFYCAEEATVNFYKYDATTVDHTSFDCTQDNVGNGLVGCYSVVSPTTWWFDYIRSSYVLSGGKMRKIGKADVTIGANRCFFDPSKCKNDVTPKADAASVRLEIDGDIATGIDAVDAPAVEGKIYELDGREATTMVKGRIYVVNGMKVQVK